MELSLRTVLQRQIDTLSHFVLLFCSDNRWDCSECAFLLYSLACDNLHPCDQYPQIAQNKDGNQAIDVWNRLIACGHQPVITVQEDCSLCFFAFLYNWLLLLGWFLTSAVNFLQDWQCQCCRQHSDSKCQDHSTMSMCTDSCLVFKLIPIMNANLNQETGWSQWCLKSLILVGKCQSVTGDSHD